MPRTPELERQLWELVYELLPEQEAAALRQRISSEPEVARAYAEVKLQTEILAQAAKSELPVPVLQRPVSDGAASRDETTTPPPAAAAGPPTPAWSTAARAANWLLGLAAMLLVGLLGYSYFEPRFPFDQTTVSQLAPVGGQLRRTVFGPARAPSNRESDLLVLTQSDNGKPRSEVMRYRLYVGNAKDPVVDKSAATDDAGLLQIKMPVLPVSSSVRLELAIRGDLATPPLRADLAFDADPLTTVLTLDRASYQPGDQLWYRSLTLPPLADALPNEVAVEFSMRDPRGVQIPGAERYAVSAQGVAHGQLRVPADSADGPYAVVTDRYALVARSPSRQYSEASLGFRVGETHELEERQLGPRIRFARDRYAPGDEVTATVNLQGIDVQPAANTPLHVRAEVDGQTPLNLYTAADPSRVYPLQFRLPKELKQAVGKVTVTVGEPAAETITEAIPIESGSLAVEFYPESGSLVSGVLNRVYFSAQDAGGDAVSIQGRVVDRGGKLVVPVQSGQAGRGMFQFTPLASESYRLECDEPAGWSETYPLPTASVERFVTLDAGPGVFDEDHSLNLELRSTQCTRPLAVLTRCRGATVGQTQVSSKSFPNARDEVGVCRLDLPLDERADGVIRVTVYDLNARPPQPVAERLVFRRPVRKLNIQVAPRDSAASPDGEVELAVVVRDEQHRPQAATLGITVVPVDAADKAEDRLPSLTTQYWLTSSLDGASVSNADDYLREDPEAAVALDLLLGTQRPRWSVAIPPGKLAQSGPRAESEGRLRPTIASALDSEAAGISCLAEQLSDVASPSAREVAAVQAARELRRERMGRALFFGSLVVLIGLVAVGLLRRSAGVRVWVPVLSAATVCLLVGGLWMGRPSGSLTELAKRRAAPVDGEIQVAEAEFSKQVNDLAAPLPAELQPQSDAVAEGARPAENAKQSAPRLQRYSHADKSTTSSSAAQTADSYAMPKPTSRVDRGGGVMSAGLPAKPGTGGAELDATPPPASLKALPDTVAPAAEPVPARAPAVAVSARSAMPAASAPEAASIAAAGPRLESANAAAAKDELSDRDDVKLAEEKAAGKILGGLGDKPSPGSGGFGGAFDFRAKHLAGARPMAAKEQARDLAEEKLDKSPADKQERPWAEERRAGTGEMSPGIDWVERSNEPLYWEPQLQTNAEGRASLRFSLPSNIPAYRVSIDAHANGRIGHVHENFNARSR